MIYVLLNIATTEVKRKCVLHSSGAARRRTDMERYTKKDGDGCYVINGEELFEDQCENYCGPAADRLAAYEDTGLEPDEIKVLQEYHDLHTADDAEASRRLIELAQADREGRCVVFVSGYPVVSIYGKAEDGLCIREVSGVITEEEYKSALRREQDG